MIRWRWLALCIAASLGLIFWSASGKLKLDRSLEAMFAPTNPVRKDFDQLEAAFGVSDLILFAYRDPNLWKSDRSGLERLERIRSRIESIPGIRTAMDLSKLDTILKSWNKTQSLAGTLDLFTPSKSKSTGSPFLDNDNALAQQLRKLFEGQTHSATTDLVAIACIFNKESYDRYPAVETIEALRKIDIEVGAERFLVGQRVMIEEGFEEIERDGLRLGLFSGVSLTLLLWVGFRSLRWALINVAVVQWALIVTKGLLVLFAWELTMVSSMLSSLVTVIGVATTMHWMLGYQRFLEMGAEPEEAVLKSWSELRRPIGWACVTDAIGFVSLGFADVGPVQDYGWMMALAAMVVWAGILLLVPGLALLPLLPAPWDKRLGLAIPLATPLWIRRPVQPSRVPQDQLALVLQQSLRWTSRYAIAIVVGSATLTVAMVWGSLRLDVETDFVKNFKQDSTLVRAYRVVENELGGAGVWDVVVRLPKNASEEQVQAILNLERELRSIEVSGMDVHGSSAEPVRLSIVMSLLDTDALFANGSMVGKLSFETRLTAMRPVMGPFMDTLVGGLQNRAVVSDDKRRSLSESERPLRILLRSKEQLRAPEKRKLISEVQRVVKEYDNRAEALRELQSRSRRSSRPERDTTTVLREPRKASVVSGYYVLLTDLVSSVVADQWRCFAIAGVGVWIAMWIAVGDLRLASLALLPNILPSMCILGWFGWTNTPVNLGAAMIAAVSLGLSVDSSLHYLVRFQRERKSGHCVASALMSAQSDIGTAVLLSTFALVIGFGALATSDFLPTIVFGTTAAITMVGGLLGNVCLLPALIRCFLLDKTLVKGLADGDGTTGSGMQVSGG